MTSDILNANVFRTALGWCGLGWTDRGVARASLPEATAEAAFSRLTHGCAHILTVDLPDELAAIADGIRALMAGEDASFDGAKLDMSAQNSFERRVYAACRAIPRGQACTYGDIAYKLGDRSLARSVGVALGRNPVPPIVPCHRVLGADGRMVGFSATGGVQLKRRLLTLEGAIPEQQEMFG
ncbi:methylated-DNA--[protein]-cysteine S-methyltransferase [Amorphus orientalis]|uniref:Methylated-DNA-[protein]-cysteine S-methyltransferase n=1 Tax=Amorphus orientalis TaxID=649198 RepID=A0AAE3VMY5_9HYPH|nr:MGMT family protein [Amorphus orientalis]MDQ0315079.1 methylated-DNA-[protein]-cysteine S-methyltransferase [Amorphus orientalis]